MNTTPRPSMKTSVVSVAVVGVFILAGLAVFQGDLDTTGTSVEPGSVVLRTFTRLIATWVMIGVGGYAVYAAGVAAVEVDGWRNKLLEASKYLGFGGVYCAAVGWLFYADGFAMLFNNSL